MTFEVAKGKSLYYNDILSDKGEIYAIIVYVTEDGLYKVNGYYHHQHHF